MKRATTKRTSRKRTANLGENYLAGQLLIAMPGMRDIRFKKSVVYLCAHSAEGAMGLVVNKTLDSLTLPELMAHLEIPAEIQLKQDKVHFGGPVETARGFVLHSSDYVDEGTITVGPDFGLTATLDVLRAIGRDEGPRHTLLALGYASWAPGQLDTEIHGNVWLLGPASEELVFACDNDSKWDRAIAHLGIDVTMLSMLSMQAGHA